MANPEQNHNLSRGRFLRLLAGAGTTLLLSHAPLNVCLAAPSLIKTTDLKPLSGIGINVAPDSIYPVSEVAAIGAKWIRRAVRPQIDLTEYISQAHSLKIRVLAVIDKESIKEMGWKGAALMYAQSYPQIDYWQIGNEPDDQHGRSSWTMEPDKYEELLRVFYEVLPNKHLVAAGLSSGDPNYLKGFDLDLVKSIAVQPYGQGTPTLPSPYGHPDHVGTLLNRYRKYYKPVIISEWGVNHDHFEPEDAATYVGSMLGYLQEVHQTENIFRMGSRSVSNPNWLQAFAYYCYSDRGSTGYGLVHANRDRKLSYSAYEAVAKGNFASNQQSNIRRIYANIEVAQKDPTWRRLRGDLDPAA